MSELKPPDLLGSLLGSISESEQQQADRFSEWCDWADREIVVCKERGYLSNYQLYEHLKAGARTFGVDPGKAAREILNKLHL